ncbi:hypothetical protein DL991_27515 [Amycolatopsis sp. WAC 01375]|uniref:hypothetical protein n=1 Tax=Amycolatopsis sp. WAC 01375 TaxID=2203194 RepID=UPI000F77B115|nr:hypothetical protein [Amycolatopsis sp. WAC 01375]RSM75437.1 hypothetical protein DL991_27515 [Amycolatopsis sp. WAC 01375]
MVVTGGAGRSAEEFRKNGGTAAPFLVDVTDPEAVETSAGRIVSTFGEIGVEDLAPPGLQWRAAISSALRISSGTSTRDLRTTSPCGLRRPGLTVPRGKAGAILDPALGGMLHDVATRSWIGRALGMVRIEGS